MWPTAVLAVLTMIAVIGAAGCGSSSKHATTAGGPTSTVGTTSTADTTARSSTSATTAPVVPGTASAPTGASSSSAPDVCSLLTTDQVATVYGMTLTSHSTNAAGGGSGCNYDDNSGRHRLLVTTYSGSAFYSPDQQMQHPQSVSGSWDKGAVDASSGEIEYLAHDVTVTITDLGTTLSASQLTTLAGESAAHL